MFFIWWEVRTNQPLQDTIGFMELENLGLQMGLSTFKEEIQNMFNLISEERVKKFEQNSENLMRIG